MLNLHLRWSTDNKFHCQNLAAKGLHANFVYLNKSVWQFTSLWQFFIFALIDNSVQFLSSCGICMNVSLINFRTYCISYGMCVMHLVNNYILN